MIRSKKINKRKFAGLIAISSLSMCSYLLWVLTNEMEKFSFRAVCMIGTIITVAAFLVYIYYERTILSSFVIIFLVFILFQFGMPMIYALDADYSSSYLTRNFDDELVKHGVLYSVICFQFFAMGGIAGDNGKKTLALNKRYLTKGNIRFVTITLSLLTGIIAIPYALLNMIAALRYGYASVNANNMIMAVGGGGTNAATAIFIPSMLLWMIYSKTKQERKICSIFLITFSIIYSIGGVRSTGLTLLFVVIYFIIIEQGAENPFESRTGRRKKTFYFIFILAAIAIASISIAYFRGGQSFAFFSPFSAIRATMEEMGFSFTSICFTMKYIPEETPYQLGQSYISSIVALVPQHIDPTGLISEILRNTPERWMAVRTRQAGYNFGLGYSVIAESFYNFGYIGIAAVFLQSYIIKRIVSLKFTNNAKFSQYINLIMIYSLLTYPRRQFYTLLKAFEYDILLMIFLMYLGNSLKGSVNISQRKEKSRGRLNGYK